MESIQLSANMISDDDITLELQIQPLNGLGGGEHQRVLGVSDLTGHQVQGVPDLGPGVGHHRLAGVGGQDDGRDRLCLIY